MPTFYSLLTSAGGSSRPLRGILAYVLLCLVWQWRHEFDRTGSLWHCFGLVPTVQACRRLTKISRSFDVLDDSVGLESQRLLVFYRRSTSSEADVADLMMTSNFSQPTEQALLVGQSTEQSWLKPSISTSHHLRASNDKSANLLLPSSTTSSMARHRSTSYWSDDLSETEAKFVDITSESALQELLDNADVAFIERDVKRYLAVGEYPILRGRFRDRQSSPTPLYKADGTALHLQTMSPRNTSMVPQVVDWSKPSLNVATQLSQKTEDTGQRPEGTKDKRVFQDVQVDGEILPWGIQAIGADVVRPAPNTTREKLLVCIIDSGLEQHHADLKQTERTATGDGSDWRTDFCGHGTHVAGTIAAIRQNLLGIAGAIPEIAVHVVKAFDGQHCAFSWASGLISAAEKCKKAALRGAKIVINMSVSGFRPSKAEEAAFRALSRQGILIVAAAGNTGLPYYSYPASYPSVLSVAAIDAQGNVATFSQYNDQVDISAPGVEIVSTYKQGEYKAMEGTSMAVPHVSAAAAIVWSYGLSKGWNNQDVRTALLETAFKFGDANSSSMTSSQTQNIRRNDFYGAGVVNICKSSRRAGFDPEQKVRCFGE